VFVSGSQVVSKIANPNYGAWFTVPTTELSALPHQCVRLSRLKTFGKQVGQARMSDAAVRKRFKHFELGFLVKKFWLAIRL